MRPVTDDDEIVWNDVLEAEMENEYEQMPRRQPSTVAAESAYRLEDIRTYAEPVHPFDNADSLLVSTSVPSSLMPFQTC